MSTELIDVFDENGHATGETLPRSEVHAKKLWHRVSHVHVFRKQDGQVELLVHRRSAKNEFNPGKWDTRFGGHLKSGETAGQAAVEELRDEAGIETDLASLLPGEPAKSEGHKALISVYYYPFHGEIADLKFRDGEVAEVKWMKADDILAEMARDPDGWASSLSHVQGIIASLQKEIEKLGKNFRD